MARKITRAEYEIILKESGGRGVEGALNRVNKKLKDVTSTQERNIRGAGEMSSNMTKNFSKMSQGLSGLVHVYASLAANIFAVSAAFRVLSDAADYERMIRASEQLSIQTGQNFANVAKSLKEVSAGAIDMQTAMQTANLGLAAGFTGKQMQNITKLATQAGIALGRSVPDAIQRLTTAIVKGEPELTDELGIILRLKEATDDYAKARGKAAKDLTTGERLQAVYQQAIERGTPKYGAIDIEPQAYDKLLSSIKEISKVFANIVNTVLQPFVALLANSKLILGGIFLILGKILLTKTTHLFGDGLENRLLSVKQKFSAILRESEAASKKLQYFNNILARDPKKYKRDLGTTIGESLTNMMNTAATKLPKILGKGLKGRALGKSFLDALEPSIRKQLPAMITESIEAGAKNLQFKSKGEIISMPLNTKEAKEYANEIAAGVENYNDMLEAQKRMSTWWGKMLVQVESISARYTSFETKMKASALYGIEAGLTKGFTKFKENLAIVNDKLKKSNILTRTLGKGMFYAATGVGKIARGLDTVAGLMSKLMFWFGAISMAIGIINKITGVWSGNLSKANDLLEEGREISKGIKETLNTVLINPKNLDQYVTNLKKTANAIGQYSDAITKSGEAMELASKMSRLENIVDTFFSESAMKEAAKDLSSYFSEAIMGIKAMPNGDKAVEEMLSNLSLDKVKIKTTLVLDEEGIDKVTEEIKKRTKSVSDMENILATTTIQEEGTLSRMREMLSVRKSSLAAMEQQKVAIEAGVTGLGKTIQIERTAAEILKGRSKIYEAIQSGNVERIAQEAELVMGIEKSENAAGLLKAILSLLPAEIQIAVTNALELATVLAGAGRTLNNILGKYSQVKHLSIIKDMTEVQKTIKAIEDSPTGGLSFDNDNLEQNLEGLEKLLENLGESRDVLVDIDRASFGTVIDSKVDRIVKAKTRTMEDIGKVTKALEMQKRQIDVNLKLANQNYARVYEKGGAEAAAALGAVKRLGLEQIKIKTALEKVGTLSARTKEKKGGAKTTKEAARVGETALEYARQAQLIFKAVADSEYNSLVMRARGAKGLLNIETQIHEAKMEALEGARTDAKTNMGTAKNANAMAKAKLDYAKAETSMVAERLRYEKEMVALALAKHEADKKATGEEFPDFDTLSSLIKTDLMLRINEMREGLVDAITLLSNTVMNIIDTTASGIADAIVEGSNDFREKISETLKESAKAFIESSIKQLISGFFQSTIGDILSGVTDVAKGATDAATAASQMAITGANTMNLGLNTLALHANTLAMTTAGIAGGAGGIGSAIASLPVFDTGGVVNEPTIARLAQKPGMEEAIVPLTAGREIPVKVTGSSGGTVNSSVTVVINQDGSTESNSESDAREARDLSALVDNAIRRVIANERRVGGLLGA